MYKRRSNALGIIFLVMGSLLVLGLLSICTLRRESYTTLAVKQRTDTIDIKNRRGKLLDRNMIPLVENTARGASYFSGASPQKGEPLFTVRYGEDGSACHLVGYTDALGAGVCGLEKTFDSYLSTDAYSRVNVIKDAAGGIIDKAGVSYATPDAEGNSVVLTLDCHIQNICKDILKSRGITGAVVVMDVHSFDILAMASSPTYSQQNVALDLGGKDGRLINRCLAPYNAGSIFKMVTLCAAAEHFGGGIKFFCQGNVDVAGHSFCCHKKEGHGLQTVTDAMKNSCNCSFYYMGMRLGADAITQKAEDFGLGEGVVCCTDFEENTGNLPRKQSYAPADVANYAIGQGEILITPLQAANMTAIIANGGVMCKANIATGVMDSEGRIKRILREVGTKRVTTPEASDIVQEGMLLAVREGTAKCLKDNPARIAGKTGTAETGWQKDGKTMVHGWFCGYFPYDDPGYAMAVLVENGGSGAQSAAPVFGEIAEEIIKIYPIG